MTRAYDSKSNEQTCVPQFTSRCFKLKTWSKWIPKVYKYLFPKSIRFKLITVLTFLCLSLCLFYLSCFSQSSLSPLCESYVSRPSLGFFGGNDTNRQFAYRSRHLPHCIIIGIRKAGTRALINYLGIHPDIVTASKEIHFFDIDENYMQGLEYYRRLLPHSFPGQITIEKTPAYFSEAMVPDRVYRMNSSIRLLLIVREPVTRLISDYTQLREQRVKRNKTPIPFEIEVLDKDGEVDTAYKPVQTSMYYTHMVRWMEFFEWEQIHIVDGDQLVIDPYSEVYKVETFLGLKHHIHKEYFTFNETKGFFCVNKATMRSCLHDTKGRRHQPVDPDLLNKLYKFYEPRNKLFFKFINRTFDWEMNDDKAAT